MSRPELHPTFNQLSPKLTAVSFASRHSPINNFEMLYNNHLCLFKLDYIERRKVAFLLNFVLLDLFFHIQVLSTHSRNQWLKKTEGR